MTLDHSTIEELLAVRALGGLDGDDTAELARLLASHGDCVECRRIGDGFDEVAGRLAMALDPIEPSPAIAERIVAIERGDAEDASPAARTAPHGRRLAALAVAAVLVVVVIAVGIVRSGRTPVTLAAGQTFTNFDAPAGGGMLTLAHTPGEPGAFFWGRDLLDPGAGRVYEIWMIRDGTPVSGGCVPPSDGRLALFVDASLDEAQVMAVTFEDPSCPSAPTTDPVYVAELA